MIQSANPIPLNIQKNEMSWFRPVSLDELLRLKEKFKGHAKIVVGNTELGVEMRARRCLYPVMIQPNKVQDGCLPQFRIFYLYPYDEITCAETFN